MSLVVIVEDDKLNRTFFESALQANGHEVIATSSAEQGLAVIRERLPDVVVMNAGLPNMNGLEATRVLRADPQIAHIPVLIVSSQSSSDFRQIALDAGGSDFLQKPFGAVVLRDAINRLLNR